MIGGVIDPGSVGPDGIWRAWTFDPAVTVGLIAAGLGYVLGYRRLRHSRPTTADRRAIAFVFGLLVVALALVSPLDRMAEALFSAHMVQHLLLIVVAAPLLVLSRPGKVVLAALPPRLRGQVAHVGSRVGRSRPGSVLHRAVPAWAIFTITLWVWHMPLLYDSALKHAPVHALEHASFLFASILVWSVAMDRRSTGALGALGRALLLVAAAVQGGLLGAVLLFASAPLYQAHGGGPRAWGLSPLLDQQLAGAIMWVPPSVVYLAAAAAILFGAFRAMDRGSSIPERGGSTRSRSVARMTWLLVIAVAFGLMACTGSREAGPRPFRPPGITSRVTGPQAGRVLYDSDCAWCHGGAGEGTRFGPSLDGALDGGAYTHFMLETGRMPLDDPNDKAVRHSRRYDAGEIAAIVAHVESFGGSGPDVPEPDPAAGDLARGAELYLADCAACHSSTGAGGALTSGEFVPDLYRASPKTVAEAMLVGPGCPNASRSCGPGEGAMPRFSLPDEDVDSIALYVLHLQNLRDRGGASIGRIGPVAEGAVAILVGLGALLLVSRWIGTRVEEDDR